MKDVSDGNYDSAITKCRTLLEEVFCYVIEKKGEAPSESGEIGKLYSQVKSLYSMHQDKDMDIDPEPLFDCYEEEDEEVAEMEQIKEHKKRLMDYDEGPKYFVVGNKLMRTYLAGDDSWDYELYNINMPDMKIVDSGQIGENGNLTRDEAINKVLSWKNLNKEKRYPTCGVGG